MKSIYKALFLICVIFITSGCSSNNSISNSTTDSNNNINIINTPTPTPSPIPTMTPIPTPPAPPQTINIRAAGDTIFETHVASCIDSIGVESFISDIAPFLRSSDISIINLETPLSLRGEKEKDKQFNFRGKPEYINILKSCGIDVVSLANNHILDYGVEAFKDTMDLLSLNKIGYLGAGNDINSASKPLYFEKNGIKVSIIASSRVIPFVTWTAGNNYPGVASTYDPTRMIKEIETARKNSDVVICYVHWGEELKSAPVEHQKKLARAYIDNGADIVIGTHPHILQGMEFYKNKLICYSLGNFIFTDLDRETAILDITIDDKTNLAAKIIPFEIKEFRTRHIKDTLKAQKLYRGLEEISFGIKISENGTITPE